MTSTLLIQLIITCFLGAASPGPSLVLVSKNAIINGKFSGSLTGFGHGIGIFIYAFLSIISIGVINDINTLLIDIITIVLVSYMLFLAFRIYKYRKANTENNSKKALFQNFYDGFLICFLNPKITVFFFAIFSQLVSNDMTLLDKLIFALVASVIDFLWYTLVSFMVGNSSVRNILNKGNYLSLASSLIFVFLSIFILIKIFIWKIEFCYWFKKNIY